ncbi:MAG: outer membrane beta-barrel protein [Bacteroidetes bacterium]|nr:outer membrane beta-barrel protein [Bacteroidota bacterium]
MTKTKYLLLLLLLFFGKSLFAQAPAWGGGADQQDYSFGFTFQYVTNYFKIDKKPTWRNPYFDPVEGKNITDQVNSISSPNTSGFAVGFLYRYSLTDFLEARTTPSLVFADRAINYTYATPSENVSKSVQAVTLDFPLEMKLKSDRLFDFRAYMLAGIKYSMAISSKKNAPDIDPLDAVLRNKGGYGSYEVGLGCDIYLEYFKLSPEIKISNSLGNVLISEPNPYASPLSKLQLHTVTFSLIFE